MQYYRKASHNVYDCSITLFGSLKYRYPVLVGDLGTRVRELIREKCKDYSVEIIRGKIARNHVHIYVSIPPYLSVSKLVKYLKGKTSRKIQQEFPEIWKKYWGQYFWGVGYFVRTTGNVTDEMIKNYIDNHKKDDVDDKYGDFQVE